MKNLFTSRGIKKAGRTLLLRGTLLAVLLPVLSPGQTNPVNQYIIRKDSFLIIHLNEGLDTDKTGVGFSFGGVLYEPLTANGVVVVPKGTPVTGHVVEAENSGKITGKPRLTLELTSITIGQKPYNLATSSYSEVGPSQGKRAAKGGILGAVAGAAIGGAVGGGKGAIIGAAAGGTAGVAATPKKRIKLSPETLLSFRLKTDVVIEQPAPAATEVTPPR